jgi:hypothetical protein
MTSSLTARLCWADAAESMMHRACKPHPDLPDLPVARLNWPLDDCTDDGA